MPADRRRRPLLEGFAPVADRHARLLILGSMPGAASLAAGQYYAHPRNAFWPMLEAVWGIPRDSRYATRVRAVRSAGLAIWDVLARCHRSTSLDQDIEPESIVVNDFSGFFQRHPGIRLIAFNGGMARTLYRRLVVPTLPIEWRDIPQVQMPSTSPAHAARPPEQKFERWRELLSGTG